jgi:putative DNA primase/helicase
VAECLNRAPEPQFEVKTVQADSSPLDGLGPVAAIVAMALRLMFSIIPCHKNKHPAVASWRPYQEQPADIAEVKAWASLRPDAWAIVTGAVSGVIVLDFDAPDGCETMERLGLRPHVKTPNGGYHVYLEYPGWRVKTLNCKADHALGRDFSGLDIKGDGGYVLFAGRNQTGEYVLVREDLRPDPLTVLSDSVRERLGLLHPPDHTEAPAPPVTAVLAPTHPTRVEELRLVDRALQHSVVDGRNGAGFWLACQLRDNGYSMSEAYSVMMAAYRPRVGGLNMKGQPEPYTQSEVWATIQQAYSQPAREPWAVTRRPQQQLPSLPAPAGVPAVDGAMDIDLANLAEITDTRTSQALTRAFHGEFRYCYPFKEFLTWDGRRYTIDRMGEIHRMASMMVERLIEVANSLTGADRAAFLKAVHKLENRDRHNAMIEMAKAVEGVAVLPDQLDAHPMLLTVENGVIDLKTGELLPHDQSLLMTKLAPATYDQNAEAPLFMNFLRRIFNDDQNLIRYVQKVMGYTLTGDVSEKVFFILHGAGDNGKSVFLELLMALLGDYARTIPAEVLMFDPRRNPNAPSPEIAKLRGARGVSASEAEAEQFLAEAMVKRMTGRDTITARNCYTESFEYIPQFKLFLATNHLPKLKGQGEAIWGRVRILPFSVSIPKAEQDKHLLDRLLAERAGILRWAVEGCLGWQQEGLDEPAAVRAAGGTYRRQMDTASEFIEQICVADPAKRVKKAALYESYKLWTQNNGKHAVGNGEFRAVVERAGYESKHFNDGDYWMGVRLIGECVAAE